MMAPVVAPDAAALDGELPAEYHGSPVRPGQVAVDESLSVPIDLFHALMRAGEETRVRGQHRFQPQARRLRRHDLAVPKKKALPGPLPKAHQGLEQHQPVTPPCPPLPPTPPAQVTAAPLRPVTPPSPPLPAPECPLSWASPCPWASPCARRARGADKPAKPGKGWLFSMAARCASLAAALGSPGLAVAADAIAEQHLAIFSADAEDLV